MQDIIGNKYNKLTVVAYAGKERNFYKDKPKGWKHYYNCLCECGNTTRVIRSSLVSSNTKSCGCLGRVTKGTIPVSKQPEYKVWLGMKGRCNNPLHVDWLNYGMRGIKVCEEWLNDYSQFIKDMGTRPEGLTIERIDNDKGYSPDNCKWDTRSNQLRNRRPFKCKPYTRKKTS